MPWFSSAGSVHPPLPCFIHPSPLDVTTSSDLQITSQACLHSECLVSLALTHRHPPLTVSSHSANPITYVFSHTSLPSCIFSHTYLPSCVSSLMRLFPHVACPSRVSSLMWLVPHTSLPLHGLSLTCLVSSLAFVIPILAWMPDIIAAAQLSPV